MAGGKSGGHAGCRVLEHFLALLSPSVLGRVLLGGARGRTPVASAMFNQLIGTGVSVFGLATGFSYGLLGEVVVINLHQGPLSPG